MSELEDDLRATTEDIAADAGQLQTIEEEKGSLDPEDPRMTALSEEGERLAREMVPKTVIQRRLVDEANGRDDARVSGVSGGSGVSGDSGERDGEDGSGNGRQTSDA